MNGSVFLDTNILVYLYSEKEPLKRNITCDIINNYICVTSTQTFNEASNVWFKKYGWNGVKIEQHLDNIEKVCESVIQIQRSTINKALVLKDSYSYSYYDCLMLASALENNCDILFSEDMSNGQIIENKLKIINPFVIP